MAKALSSGRSKQLTQPQLEQLVTSLTNAVSRGDSFAAAEVARNLAAEQVTLEIPSVTRRDNKKKDSESDEPFTLHVQIEDRQGPGPKVPVKVRENTSFMELKMMFFNLHSLPVECQKWIHKKSLKGDRDTLGACGINASGHTVFLYLVSKDVAQIRGDRSTYQLPVAYQQDSPGQGPHRTTYNMTLSPMSGDTRSISAQAVPGVQPGHVEPKRPPVSDPFQNINILPQPILLDAVGGPKVPAPPAKPPAVKEDSFLWRPPNDAPVEFNIPLVRPGTDQPRHPQPLFEEFNVGHPPRQADAMTEPEDDIPSDGWVCSACTFKNHPTRPGCTMCAGNRPDEYAVPARFNDGVNIDQARGDYVRAEQQRLYGETRGGGPRSIAES